MKLLQMQKSKLQARRYLVVYIICNSINIITNSHRVPVGSSKIKVSSTMTLMDLKLEVINFGHLMILQHFHYMFS